VTGGRSSGRPPEHSFGGTWTEDKLARVRGYLGAYTTIFASNERARHLRTTYVDAFAGTGARSSPAQSEARLRQTEGSLFEDAEADPEARSFKRGSARAALEVDPAFDRYVFVDRNPGHAEQLRRLGEEFPEKAGRISVEAAEANSYLRRWCAETDWNRNRAVVFLDPYGMQVDWSTIEAIAATECVDLWVLFPLGQAVNRLLTRRRIPEGAPADRLTRHLGTDSWKEEFYRATDAEADEAQPSMFEEIEEERGILKTATLDAIGAFFVRRLGEIFAGVAPNPLMLRNSRNVPIYLLCFAAGNPRGAPTAVRIAGHLLGRRPGTSSARG
jgi:three-Cys-motif partner protein